MSFEEVKQTEDRRKSVANFYQDLGLTKEKTNLVLRIANVLGVTIPGKGKKSLT